MTSYFYNLRIAKQVLRYLKGTMTLGIEWGNDPAGHRSGGKYGEMGVVRYADSSYASDLEDRKSIAGYCFFLGKAIVTWCSKRQHTVSTSAYLRSRIRGREPGCQRESVDSTIAKRTLTK